MTYVPEAERTTIWYLKHKLFRVGIPQLRSRSLRDMELFGTQISGDHRIDRENASAENICMISIDKMLEYHVANIPVRVLRREDTKQIYEYIKAHLEAWAKVFSETLNTEMVPIEDLILLDELANKVYVHARHHFDRKWVQGKLSQGIAGIMAFNFQNIVQKAPATGAATDEEMEAQAEKYLEELPKREQLADFFQSRQNGLGVRL